MDSQLSDSKFNIPLNPSNGSTRSKNHRCGSSCSQKLGLSDPHSPSLGKMGSGELVIKIIFLLLDVVTDGLLLYTLWKQAESHTPYYFLKKEERKRFLITTGIIVIQTILNNTLSLVWYFKSRNCSGLRGASIISKDSIPRKILCIILHIFAIGQIMRYIDIFRHRRRIHSYVTQWIRVEGHKNYCPPRTTSRGEISLGTHKVLSKDTVILDTMRAFLQDCPVILLQIFILYRTRLILTPEQYKFNKHWNMGSMLQVTKIVVSLCYATMSLVEFQFMTTKDENEDFKIGQKIACLLRRFTFIGARVIAIGSFAALHINREGGLLKSYLDNIQEGFILSFPTMICLIIIGHWSIMVIWIYSQNTKFCSTENGTPRPIREFFFDLFVAWIHVFDYINLKYSPTRKRIMFFYILIFVENTALTVILFLQLVSIKLWIRVSVIFVTQSLFLIGLSCLILYYAFQHNYSDTRQLSSTKYNHEDFVH